METLGEAAGAGGKGGGVADAAERDVDHAGERRGEECRAGEIRQGLARVHDHLVHLGHRARGRGVAGAGLFTLNHTVVFSLPSS